MNHKALALRVIHDVFIHVPYREIHAKSADFGIIVAIISEKVCIFAAGNKVFREMADYKKFFKRENFIASMQAAKERKQKWEREVQQKWDELNKELEPNDTKIAL